MLRVGDQDEIKRLLKQTFATSDSSINWSIEFIEPFGLDSNCPEQLLVFMFDENRKRMDTSSFY